MSRNQLRSGDEEGFLLACHDDIRETEQMYRVHVQCELVAGRKRGEWRFLMTAVRKAPDGSAVLFATGEYPYPSASARTLYAAFYRACVRIGAECARAHREESGDWTGQPVRQPDNDK